MRWSYNVYVSVNVSAAQLSDPTFVGIVDEILSDTGLAPERLELEITESSAGQCGNRRRDIEDLQKPRDRHCAGRFRDGFLFALARQETSPHPHRRHCSQRSLPTSSNPASGTWITFGSIKSRGSRAAMK
ncbi:hypothetical protein [Aureimonas altamirensis]|uniref:hypothetical protein n=1 Tax=Aureimonas altamirensis TaxID=370622 RepID=UPI003B96E634